MIPPPASDGPPGYLRIISATWGSPDRPGQQVDVTGTVSRWVEEKGYSRFFYFPPRESKEDLLGDPQKGMEKDLTIEYQFAQFPPTSETFQYEQEVLIGDVEGYYQSISDVYGTIPDDWPISFSIAIDLCSICILRRPRIHVERSGICQRWRSISISRTLRLVSWRASTTPRCS